jgi:uroporphyrinogen decarboxylase
VQRWKRRDYPLGLYVSRGILLSLDVGDWATLSDALLALTDTPDAVEAAMESLAEMTVSLLEPAMREIRPDFAVFSEPIASFHAPVISPAHYRRFYGPVLQKIVAMLEAHGVEIRIVQTYGNSAPLLPIWLDMGLNTFWFYHAHPAGIDYPALRRRYGRDLRLIGGIDAQALLKDLPAIDEAVRAIVPALFAEGRYLPLLEDRVRSFVPYSNYRYYRRRLLEAIEEL